MAEYNLGFGAPEGEPNTVKAFMNRQHWSKPGFGGAMEALFDSRSINQRANAESQRKMELQYSEEMDRAEAMKDAKLLSVAQPYMQQFEQLIQQADPNDPQATLAIIRAGTSIFGTIAKTAAEAGIPMKRAEEFVNKWSSQQMDGAARAKLAGMLGGGGAANMPNALAGMAPLSTDPARVGLAATNAEQNVQQAFQARSAGEYNQAQTQTANALRPYEVTGAGLKNDLTKAQTGATHQQGGYYGAMADYYQRGVGAGMGGRASSDWRDMTQSQAQAAEYVQRRIMDLKSASPTQLAMANITPEQVQDEIEMLEEQLKQLNPALARVMAPKASDTPPLDPTKTPPPPPDATKVPPPDATKTRQPQMQFPDVPDVFGSVKEPRAPYQEALDPIMNMSAGGRAIAKTGEAINKGINALGEGLHDVTQYGQRQADRLASQFRVPAADYSGFDDETLRSFVQTQAPALSKLRTAEDFVNAYSQHPQFTGGRAKALLVELQKRGLVRLQPAEQGVTDAVR